LQTRENSILSASPRHRVTASPDGLASVRGVIIAYGRVDWSNVGPLSSTRAGDNQASLIQWEDALQDLEILVSLRELQIYMYQRNRCSYRSRQGVNNCI
jgi:hypothetical protein